MGTLLETSTGEAGSGEQPDEEPRSGRRKAKIDEDWDSESTDDGIINQVSQEGNTCAPYCTSCEPKDVRATGEWCLLECNNPGAPRCLDELCDCS